MADNHIELTVQTLEGAHTESFNIHQKLRHVVEQALKALGIDPPAEQVWILTFNGQELDLNTSIEAAQIPDHATLLLAPREAGGGGR